MTETQHPNAARIQAFVDAIGGGDLDGAIDMFSEDDLYHVPGSHGNSGTYRGRQALKEFLIKIWETTGGRIKLISEEVLADDAHAVWFWGLEASRPDGRSIDAHGSMAFKLNPEGEFTEAWFLYSDQKAYDAFWA